MGILGGPKALTEPTLVADLIDQTTSSWKIDLLYRFFDLPIIQQITDIQLRPHFTTDDLIWTATKQGTFTVKSAYHAITQTQSVIPTSNASTSYQIPTWLWRHIWKMPAAPKIRVFLWSVCRNALATRENSVRGLNRCGTIPRLDFLYSPLIFSVWTRGSFPRLGMATVYLAWLFFLIFCGKFGEPEMASSSAELLQIQRR